MSKTTFSGADYVEIRDKTRLTGQMLRIFDILTLGKWVSLKTLSNLTKAPEASVSAQLRNLRKPQFGSWKIDRKHIVRGFYQYRLDTEDRLKML